MEITLNLRKYCIETAVKRSYNRLLSEYFKSGGGNAESEEKLDLLQKALSRFDFSALRTLHKELAGKTDARILLKDNGGGPPEILIDGHPVKTEDCIRE